MRSGQFYANPPHLESGYAVQCPICQGQARRFGRNRNGSQRYQCETCNHTFTDARTQPQDGRRVPIERMAPCLGLLLEGSSVRSLERTQHIHRNTIIDAMVDAGTKAKAFLEKRIHHLHVNDVQVDEIWGFVKMKEKKRVRHEEPECYGDAWCFTAIERTTKLLLAWHLGKRTPTDTANFADNLYHATQGRFQLTTDGYTPYLSAIQAILGSRVDYATLVKVYGDTQEEHRYSPGEVIGVIATPKLGEPERDRICTSHIERSNRTWRMQIRRMTRLTDAHSKKWENHEAAFALFFAYYNFCRVHMTLKMTPAQKAGLTVRAWSLQKLLQKLANY